MKTRIIELSASGSFPSNRLDVDDTWKIFASHLVSSFGDILHQNGYTSDITSNIYCTQRMRKLDETILDSLVFNVPPSFVDELNLFGAKNQEDAVSFLDNQVHWAASREAPFLLLGFIGTGKTTLLDHYFYDHIPLKSSTEKGIIVNFKLAPDSDDEFIYHLLDSIDVELCKLDESLTVMNRELYEKLFIREIASIKSTLYSIPEQEKKIDELLGNYVTCKVNFKLNYYKELIRRKIDYVRNNKSYRIWIVLDNIDQHFDCLHHRAFINAVSIAWKFACPLIICMRYITLNTPGARETYDSYRPRRLQLSLPDITNLINKRLDYFRIIAKESLMERLKNTGYFKTVGELLEDIAEAVKLLGSQTFLTNFLLPLSNYNLRRLLDILVASFSSYYFYFDRFNNERYRPTISNLEKRFLYSHLLKNSSYYEPDRDAQELFIINLFENENKTAVYNQTIRIRLLQALMSTGRSIIIKQFTSLINKIFDYDKFDILSALRLFKDSQLIAIKPVVNSTNVDYVILHNLNIEDLESTEIEIALTRAGRVHYELIAKLEYVEIMKLSTFIYSDKYREIQGEDNQKTFVQRKKTTLEFLNYLMSEETKEIKEIVKDQKTFNEQFGLVFPSIVTTIRNRLDSLESSI